MANVIRQDWTALETLKARNASPFICSTEQNFFRKKSVKKKIQEHSLQSRKHNLLLSRWNAASAREIGNIYIFYKFLKDSSFVEGLEILVFITQTS